MSEVCNLQHRSIVCPGNRLEDMQKDSPFTLLRSDLIDPKGHFNYAPPKEKASSYHLIKVEDHA